MTTTTELEIAKLRAGLVARVDAGRAREILLQAGVSFPQAVNLVLDARQRWRALRQEAACDNGTD